MPKIARIGDPISCGDHIGTGSHNVFVNGIPVARDGDITCGHCFPPVPLIPQFANTIFVNNKKVALVEKTRIPSHCCRRVCHDGFVSDGSPDVFGET